MEDWVDITSLREDPNNPRTVFSPEHIEGLSKSLSIEGMINPIEVDSSYMIITGHCRFRAAQVLGWERVPVIINESSYSEYERLRHQMAENIHQSGTSQDSMMSPIDTAKGYARMISLKTEKDYKTVLQSRKDMYGVIKAISQEVGITTETIYEFLRILEEPEYVIEDIKSGRPRSYYKEAARMPEDFKGDIKQKIAKGDYRNREEIKEDVRLVKKFGDVATLERERTKESQATNRILNGVARLGLALVDQPFSEVSPQERGIVVKQLKWMERKIEEYLGENDS